MEQVAFLGISVEENVLMGHSLIKQAMFVHFIAIPVAQPALLQLIIKHARNANQPQPSFHLEV